MTSHVEQQIAARITAVRARQAQAAVDRAARAEQRAHGVAARHAAKLRYLAQRTASLPLNSRSEGVPSE
ncbi:hypothetical protein [Streptomyces sp. NPDC057580]|uniref:hypothetical protein n=1 Tax=Streptomyces sp. NPDC057580 TaxID=3346173 RepID=UPI0036AA8D9E